MLVVWGRKEIGPSPPVYRVQGLASSDHEAVEGYREGVRVETPKSPLSQVAWKEKATETVLRFLGGTRVGCISTRRKPPEEDCDGDGAGEEGDEGGPGPPQMQFLLFFRRWWEGREDGLLFSFVISFVFSFVYFFSFPSLGGSGLGLVMI